MSTILSYSDPETGERRDLDITGWQIVIDSHAGEIMRTDFVMLVLSTMLRANSDSFAPFSRSLLSFGDEVPMVNPPTEWFDVKIERRA